MDISRMVLKAANFLVSAVVMVLLLTGGVYSVYALWDNQQVSLQSMMYSQSC